MFKYKYLGTEAKHLPKQGVNVKEFGDIVESKIPIDHPEFEYFEETKHKK